MLLEFGAEQNNLLIDSSLKLTSSPVISPFGASQSPLIDTAIQQLELKLQQLATAPELTDKMDQAFGNNWDIQKAQSLTQDWLTGEFKGIPEIKIVSQADINGANGAFADAIDTIYLSREFLAQNTVNPEAVVDVLLEETGHFIDSVVNFTDTPGDEGERFAAVVQGKTLTPAQLAAIQAEDDTATVVIDGQTLVIEKAANTVTLSTPDASAAEVISGQTANPGLFTVTRTGDTTSALTVNYTVAGTATKGIDYSNLTGSVTIPIGATTANIPITVIDDTSIEGSETAIVNLSTATTYNLGTAKTGTVTIADNDKTGKTNTDVDGDGRDDAIVSIDSGIVVRRSDGTKFLPNELWTDIGYWGTKGTGFADVTGDGKADAIAANDNGVFIRRSDGSKFLPNELWTDVGYWGTKGTWFADVTGDGKADAIAANDNGVFIRRSNGTGFLPNEKWTDIGYWGTKGTWFADVTGDGKADAIASNDNGVFIRRSDGSKFLPNELWTDIGYWGTKGTWFGDVALSNGNPHLGYYGELSSFNETQWDQQSGDDNQFRPDSPYGGGDQRWKTDDRIRQIYTDLSTVVFGTRKVMNTGYAYDSGYYSALGNDGRILGSHSGIDIDGSIGTPVGAAVRGTVAKVEYHTGNGSWIAIDEIDSSNNKTGRRWWYGHLSSATNVSQGTTVIPGQKLGTTNDLGHLHLSVINTYNQVTDWNEIANAKTGNYNQDVQTVLNRTMSPIQGYWKSKNGIKE